MVHGFGLLRRRALLGALSCLAAVGLSIPTAAAAKPHGQAPTSLTSCQDISSPGHYRLDTNITTDAPFCFVIDANDVMLNLNDHMITGPGPRGTAFGIGVGGSGVRIEGPGVLSGWDGAIALDGGDGSVLGVMATENGTGISVASDDNSVHGSVISGNIDFGIIVFPGATGNRIEGNFALRNGIDLSDQNPNCDSNLWRGNGFRTAVPASCIH
jgi:hypothetical protein